MMIAERFLAKIKVSEIINAEKSLGNLNSSVQAENENFSAPTFLEAFDLNFHMPGHFLL